MYINFLDLDVRDLLVEGVRDPYVSLVDVQQCVRCTVCTAIDVQAVGHRDALRMVLSCRSGVK